MQYLVLEPCKAGPGVYLKPGDQVDTDQHPGITADKWAELVNGGLLLSPTPIPSEPVLPLPAEEKGKGK